MLLQRLSPLLLLLALGAPPIPAQSPPGAAGEAELALARIVDRVVDGERRFLERMQAYEPYIETYIQTLPEDAGSKADAVRDQYLMGKVRLGPDGVEWRSFAESEGFRRPGKFLFVNLPKKGFIASGFAQMIVPDAHELDAETYSFEYLRREFLGDVRALVFNVRPTNDRPGKFIGRIWVEDRDFRIVRFNGTYTGGSSSARFFHFDSWRVNVEPGFWVPAYIYVLDQDVTSPDGARFKAQSRLWNYNGPRPDRLDELTEVLIESERPVEDGSPNGVSPLESQRMWDLQAQRNVLERLERAGLLAPKGETDDVLDTVVNNLLISNDIGLEVECRVLLTTPLETFSLGQAIVISRGLIDVLPDEGALAMALADELAHIVLGHRNESMFAFSDFTIFDDSEALARLRLARPADEIAAASAKALEMLARSPYADNLGQAGLFLKALQSRAKQLPNLIESNFGNSLARRDRLAGLSALVREAPELAEGDLEQIAALPLGSRIRLDPWTNRIELLDAEPVTLRSARDKLPFQVTPFMPALERVAAPQSAQPEPAEAPTSPLSARGR